MKGEWEVLCDMYGRPYQVNACYGLPGTTNYPKWAWSRSHDPFVNFEGLISLQRVN